MYQAIEVSKSCTSYLMPTTGSAELVESFAGALLALVDQFGHPNEQARIPRHTLSNGTTIHEIVVLQWALAPHDGLRRYLQLCYSELTGAVDIVRLASVNGRKVVR